MPVNRPVQILIHDSHSICVESFAAALNDTFDVIAATTELRDLVDLVDATRPDVCLIGIDSAGDRYPAAISQILARTPKTRVVTVLPPTAAGVAREALAAGARGFVGNDAPVRTLNHTIDRVAAGQARVGAEAFLHQATASRSRHAQYVVQLTEREQEVLERLIAGEDTRHIAAALHICRSTARTHVQNVRLKLGAQTRLQAVAYAVGAPGRPSRLVGRTIAG